jgi:hypothetical protein
MAKTPPVVVNTADLLREVHAALQRAGRTEDQMLYDAAVSVMSALTRVLRFPQAELPSELEPFIARVRQVT